MICPDGWSAEEGEGIDVGGEAGFEFPVGDGMGVKPLKTGVEIVSTGMGEEKPEGVAACSVAKRSAVGAGAGLMSPHPRRKMTAPVSQMNLTRLVIQFD